MARPRKNSLPELLAYARDAVRVDPDVSVTAFRQEVGGGATRDALAALKVAKWERGDIAGDAEAVLDPRFLELVNREDRLAAPADLDLAAPSEVLLTPVTNAMAAMTREFERLLASITDTAVRRIGDERRRADNQAVAAAQHEHGLGLMVEQLGRELAETEREAGVERGALRQEVALQAQELESLRGQLGEARAGIQAAEAARVRAEQERAKADEVRARTDRAAIEERAAIQGRYEAELRDARESVGRSEARAETLQAQVVDLRQRLTDSGANLERALDAGAKARAEAAAAAATLREARDAHRSAIDALNATIEELNSRIGDLA